MRNKKESKDLAETMINVIHTLLTKNNLSLAIKNGELIIVDHDIDKYYKFLRKE